MRPMCPIRFAARSTRRTSCSPLVHAPQQRRLHGKRADVPPRARRSGAWAAPSGTRAFRNSGAPKLPAFGHSEFGSRCRLELGPSSEPSAAARPQPRVLPRVSIRQRRAARPGRFRAGPPWSPPGPGRIPGANGPAPREAPPAPRRAPKRREPGPRPGPPAPAPRGPTTAATPARDARVMSAPVPARAGRRANPARLPGRAGAWPADQPFVGLSAGDAQLGPQADHGADGDPGGTINVAGRSRRPGPSARELNFAETSVTLS